MIGELGKRGIGWYLDADNEEAVQEIASFFDVTGTNPGNWAGLTLGTIYVVWPLDFIPDFIPGIGYMDDAAILRLSWTVGGKFWEFGDWLLS